MMVLKIPSVWGEEKRVLAYLSKYLSIRAYREEDCLDLRTAVAEACLNAMEHGNQLNVQLFVEVVITLCDDVVTVTISDRGVGTVTEWRNAKLMQDGDAGNRGWGMFLIPQLVDEWTMYCPLKSRGFAICLKKKMIHVQRGESCGTGTDHS